MKMINVLFICHGNICRSPMAEFMFKKMVEDHHEEALFHIESAATSREEIGNGVYPSARYELKKHGIICRDKYARQVTKKDYEAYDYLICMDAYNVRNLQRIIGDDPLHKVHLLLSFTDHARDVADPWYTDDFETTWNDLEEGLEAFYKYVRAQQK